MSGAAPAKLVFLQPGAAPNAFPDIDHACSEPNGLLAAGGDLSEARLLYAYRHGIFPWYSEGEPILWWSPEPRCVLRPGEYHVARRLRRWLASSTFKVRFNTVFDQIVAGCAEQRFGQDGTWITAEMMAAYRQLHLSGWAHSVEIWSGSAVVGGMYGLAIGKVFFGESMFSRETNASKLAMFALCRQLQARSFALLDCQVVSPHLLSLGAISMPRSEFRSILMNACASASPLTDLPRVAVAPKSLI
ncbi:MAG: leucyl/phenylalanyl-tRNA--protein transferase [Woeseia sp.]|nr:leucyl/phenylalanyl-tRNA--protein transferase [Woeseia sp.]MBT8095655.1 leucyl/phenylalanyl-tRNA--protein transferase [Woeseia sp.]NNE59455.1 leucyl/phenylalanyl-tRNA--protein transferase [Woeseia sp.]NNL54639.1 leucyl/phenylalanyl-tRNA--protein transferase [Woeseia sp.]